MDILNVLKKASLALESGDCKSPRLDAEVLLSSYLKKDRTCLYTHPEQSITEGEYTEFQEWVERRKRGEPVAYIVGEKEFWSLPFQVNNHVLVPRPETEILVEEVLKVCSDMGERNFRILDIGTGCGAISVALASELKSVQIVATDISQEALAVAIKNAQKNSVDHRISFLLGNLFQPVSGKFDIIVSNPPYISLDEYNTLPFEVRGFEPKSALLAGNDGTEFHRKIIKGGVLYLQQGGWLFMEIGSGQKHTVENILNESNLYDSIAFTQDYAGIERVSRARRVTTGG
ncbi:MAG: peptide chain release factor N(5)-glutamine methyltransferase [Syntrophaceae bacterium]